MTYSSPVETILTDLEEGVLTISLNRPDSLNALRPEMISAIGNIVGLASSDHEVSVIILDGIGRAFCAGVDLKVLQGVDPHAGKIGNAFDQPASSAWSAIRNCDCPVIAKVHGACFTGALELALHCDLIYTTEDTKFGDTHAKFGLRPTWGMSQTLSRAIGVRHAKELSFTARTITGKEAVKLGLVNAATPNKTSLDELVAIRTGQIVSNSQSTVTAIKDLYGISQLGLSLDNSLEVELNREYPSIKDTNERLSSFKS